MKGLEFIRKLYGKSLNDVALYLGVTNQAVSSWEKKNHIPVKRLNDLSNFFNGISEEYFDIDVTPDLQKKIELEKWTIESYEKYSMYDIDFDSDTTIKQLISRIKKFVIIDGNIDENRATVINRLFDITDDSVCYNIFLLTLKAVEILHDKNIKTDNDFVLKLVEIMEIWKTHYEKEQKKFEELKKQITDYDDLY